MTKVVGVGDVAVACVTNNNREREEKEQVHSPRQAALPAANYYFPVLLFLKAFSETFPRTFSTPVVEYLINILIARVLIITIRKYGL